MSPTRNRIFRHILKYLITSLQGTGIVCAVSSVLPCRVCYSAFAGFQATPTVHMGHYSHFYVHTIPALLSAWFHLAFFHYLGTPLEPEHL